jgi:hypothetical protein
MARATNTAAIEVGRLVEVRLSVGFRNVEFVSQIFADMDAAIEKLPASAKLVVAADWRFCRVMSSEAGEALVSNLARYNPRIERSAALASENSPSALLQFNRVVRSGANPDRRLFTDRAAMTSWLGEVLTSHERNRLVRFLDEPGDGFDSP